MEKRISPFGVGDRVLLGVTGMTPEAEWLIVTCLLTLEARP